MGGSYVRYSRATPYGVVTTVKDSRNVSCIVDYGNLNLNDKAVLYAMVD